MKRNVLFAAAVMLFAMAVSASAQKASDFSGTWSLDTAKSASADSSIESQTLTVTQTAADLKYELATTRKEGSESGRGRGMMGGGNSSASFSLDGKETKAEIEGRMGKMPVTYKAAVAGDGSVKLTTVRTFNGPQGEMSFTVTENWSLSADGKTLTVARESVSPRGTNTSTSVYTKK